MMEVDISCFTTAGARINGEFPIGFPSLLSRTSQKNFHVSYQLVSCEFSPSRMAHSGRGTREAGIECSPSRMAHSRRGMMEAGILFCPPGRGFTRGAQLASDSRQKEALRGVRKGWSDDERTTEAGLDSGVPLLQYHGQAYANLGTRAPFKETGNDPWENRNEFTELEPSAASLDMRGRKTSSDDSNLNFEREVADEGIAKEADDSAGIRRSTENDSFDNRNFISDRNFQTNRLETRLREVESDARTDGMSPLSFRTGGNTDAFGTRDLLKDDGTNLDAEARKDQSRNDLRYGRQLCKEEDLYEDGESEEQMNAARILMDPERSNDRYLPGGRKEILQWRNEEEALKSMNKLVEGDKRELFISDKQRALKVTAGIVDNSRMLKRSKMIAKQIISQSSAMALGFVSQIWVNTALWEVMVLEVKPSLLSGEVEGVLVNDVCQVGDVILVSDESAMESELTVLESEILVGCDLLTEDGYYLGKVRDYSFTLLDGKVTSLEFDSLGFSLVPSNLISTYWLDINEVMEVSSDSLLVKGGAESRARRLTKGILQLPRLQGQVQSKRLAGSRRRKKSPSISQELSYEGKQIPLQTKRLSSRGSVSFPKDIELDRVDRKTGIGDRWLPMDYGSSQRKT